MRSSLLIFTACLACIGCGAGQYGFDREYVPTSEEDDLIPQVSQTNYEDVKRDPADYRSALLSWFGIVTNVELDASSGRATVAVTHRTHQPRHLCGDERASSCRVTVSDRSSGPFSFVAEIRSEDRDGGDRLWNGSLVRVYGSPNGEFDDDGGPIIESRWYRHWPRGKYVTTGAAGSMRR